MSNVVLTSSDPHGHAASDHLALSALLCASGGETAASAHEGGGLRHTHGGQVAPGHVQEGVSAHAPRLRHILWYISLITDTDATMGAVVFLTFLR